MRRILCSYALLSLAVFAGDGRTPRGSAAEYPAHQDVKSAAIAAVRVSAEQLNKNFPADFAKKYVVVEVAVYPKDGASVDVAAMDFVLRLADGESRPDTAEEVASIWRPHNAHPDVAKRAHVENETGVIIGHGQDPVTGRKATNVGAYERVGVASGDDPNRQVPYPTSGTGVDSDQVEAKLNNLALQDGRTTVPVAGYLYFPVAVKKSKTELNLQYAHEADSANMKLPAPAK